MSIYRISCLFSVCAFVIRVSFGSFVLFTVDMTFQLG